MVFKMTKTVLLLAALVACASASAASSRQEESAELTEEKITQATQAVRDALLAAGPKLRQQMMQQITNWKAMPARKLGESTRSGLLAGATDKGAICKPEGDLDCEANKGTGDGPSACADKDFAKTKKFWAQNGYTGAGSCQDMSANNPFWVAMGQGVNQVAGITKLWPGKAVVITKGWVGHPHKAHQCVGAFGFKRQVCVDSADKKKRTCSNFKTAECVYCNHGDYKKGCYPRRDGRFNNWRHKRFMQKCAKFAFDANGKIKKEFECSTTKYNLPGVKNKDGTPAMQSDEEMYRYYVSAV